MANTYRCPSCGAPLEYTPGTNGLVCTYCGTEVSIEQLSRNETGENSEDRTENHTASDIEDTHARQSFNGYTCESCGAQLITDEYVAHRFTFLVSQKVDMTFFFHLFTDIVQ